MTESFLKSFSTSGLLRQLEQRTKGIQSLTDRVRNSLQGPERDHVLAAAWHEDTLVITTDSAAWTAQIRFAQEDLRGALVAQGERVFVHLKVRVGQGS